MCPLRHHGVLALALTHRCMVRVQVRMNDEDIRKEYITQMEIILNDDPSISEKVKGIAEGMSIKLGEMMDQPRATWIECCKHPHAALHHFCS
jgi:hypothetical protein